MYTLIESVHILIIFVFSTVLILYSLFTMRKTAVKKDKRTRLQKSFQQTVLKLYHKKNLDEITINEVCEKIGVPRSSFYYHYNTVRDVLEEIERDFIKSLSKTVEGVQTDIPDERERFIKLLEASIPVIKSFEQFIKTVVERKDLSFMNRWSELIANRIHFVSDDNLKGKVLSFTTIFSIADMLFANIPLTKIKSGSIYDIGMQLYAFKKDLLEA